jgi:cytochrome P450
VRHPLTPPNPARLRGAAVRDLAVYASHPLAFAALTATSRLPQLRLGTTVIVHDRDHYTEALTGIPLDRLAAGTTGGQLAAVLGVEQGLMFTDADSRAARRASAAHLSSRQVAAVAPVWRPLLQQAAASLAAGASLDVAALARRLGGVTATGVLGVSADPDRLADLVLAAAAHTTRTELRPSWANRLLRREPLPPQARELAAMMRPTGPGWLADAAQTGASPAEVAALGVTIALATVATTAAALPRAVAWCADARLWGALPEHAEALTAELLRVTAPTGVLPRVTAADAELGGCPVGAGTRLVLVARSAARQGRPLPDPTCPAPASQAQLVFGAGAHACPGARLARAQMAEVLTALSPHQPEVVSARPAYRSALPSWQRLVVTATLSPGAAGARAGRGEAAA